MKKTFIVLIMTAVITTFCIQTANAFTSSEGTGIIKEAITKYKDKNYLGCISDLRMYVKNDPSSAIAWYYLGNSYMNIAMKNEAHEAFDRVVQINSVPKLTSYAIQAKVCMDNPTRCQYQDFTYDEINKLKADPLNFLDQYFASLNQDTRSADEIEIERLIDGYYNNNIHPSAKDFIMQEKAKMKQLEINANKASIDSPDKMANEIENIKRNTEIKNLAMILETTNNKGQNNNLMNYYQTTNGNNTQMTPEMIQTMMMSNMMLMPN